MLSSVQNPRLFLLQCRLSHLHFSSKPIKATLHTSQSLTLSSSSSSPTPPTSQILTIRKSLLSREKTAVELAQDYLTRLRRSEPQLKSFLYVSEDSVLRDAQEIDKKIERNEGIGPLAGVFVGVKDNICTVDMPATAGSKILENYRPAYDATAVSKMREKGAIIVGKTNLDEFGMGSTTEGSAYQVTANPWDLSRVPGGSSGGSAAAVSARQCVVSLGSDTGGSVRQPASFCGVVGLKPTYGRVSRYGLVAYASSLDVIGCFGSSVADTGILLHAISGHDKLDATSSMREVPDFTSQFISKDISESKPLKGLRVGVIRETLDEGVDAEVVSSILSAVSHLEELGCTVAEVSLPSFSLGLPAYYILASSESSSNLSRYDGIRYGNQSISEELNSLYGNIRAHGFGSEVKRRILMGTYALSAGYYDAYYKRAQQVRTLVQKSFKAALDENDILISPAAPSAAYKIGEKKNDPLAMYAGDIMTVSKALLAEFAAAKKKNRPFKGLGLEHMNDSCPVIPSQLTSSALRSTQFQTDILCLRERDLLNRFAAEVSQHQAQGVSREQTFTMTYQLAEDLGKAFADLAIMQTFIEAEATVSAGQLKNILGLLRSMYAMIILEEDVAFLRYGYLSTDNAAAVRKEVAKLCNELRPHALALVGSFGIPDAFLSPLAFDWIEANSWSSVQN